MTPCHLFEDWKSIERRIRAASCLAVILDFDGTLAPIRARPQQVRLSSPECDALARVAHLAPTWILSGRGAADLRVRVPVPGVQLIGVYGLDLLRNGHDGVSQARRKLVPMLHGMNGVWIENKGVCFAVHYREASPRAVRAARSIVREVALPRLDILPGKKVWEVLPRNAPGKGRVVTRLLHGMPGGTLPLYAGDDVADENAFAALESWPRGALTMRVGRPHHRTAARYYLRSPRETWEMLKRLGAALV